MLEITSLVQKVRKSILRSHEMLSKGGSFLGAARSWIQWNALNGSDVAWGSEDRLQFNRSLTVKDVEEFAAKIAVATLEDFKGHLTTEGEKVALKAYMNKENWGSAVSEKNLGYLVCFNPDRDKLHFAIAGRHKHGWDLAQCVDGKEAESHVGPTPL